MYVVLQWKTFVECMEKGGSKQDYLVTKHFAKKTVHAAKKKPEEHAFSTLSSDEEEKQGCFW